MDRSDCGELPSKALTNLVSLGAREHHWTNRARTSMIAALAILEKELQTC